jgi:hypothetical protein
MVRHTFGLKQVFGRGTRSANGKKCVHRRAEDPQDLRGYRTVRQDRMRTAD